MQAHDFQPPGAPAVSHVTRWGEVTRESRRLTDTTSEISYSGRTHAVITAVADRLARVNDRYEHMFYVASVEQDRKLPGLLTIVCRANLHAGG